MRDMFLHPFAMVNTSLYGLPSNTFTALFAGWHKSLRVASSPGPVSSADTICVACAAAPATMAVLDDAPSRSPAFTPALKLAFASAPASAAAASMADAGAENGHGGRP